MQRTDTPPPPTRRQDYAAPDWLIDSVDLCFDLDPVKTRVLNKMLMRRNPQGAGGSLRLDGAELNLARVLVNGQGASFHLDGEQLVLEQLPDNNQPFEVEIFTTCTPEKNTQLMGLYVSGGSFFTQCEAQGFRRITYFLDRPDVMARYSVTLRADKTRYPVLLSNGNLVEQGELDGGRHFARWLDPHKKPSYLFALVAGQLVCREQRVRARSGSEHLLQVYVRPGDLDKTEHALASLIAAIDWDEQRFGLSLDLERFMIVATRDFNMGAMENKGLNIFNTAYVLANPATATDADYAAIESVVGHEYFHNWSGNRVTCRDWFQLSLKEGLTVFRDQEFSQDLSGSASARAVLRIEDVRALRANQFPEDAGPMAHPVRPDQYQEINNFYTATVYDKGAEVVRMMQTLVGREGFAKGQALYFQRHDGQAVTCDDFAQAIADANPDSPLAQHLAQFKLWYAQAGTPRVQASGHYDAGSRRYSLTLSQSCPATPGQAEKQAFVIPISYGLLGPDGAELRSGQYVLTQASETLVFDDLDAEPTPSLLRGFSAPVVLQGEDSPQQLLLRLAHDSDPFNRWEAGQALLLQTALSFIAPGLVTATPSASEPLLAALTQVLRDPQLHPGFKQWVLTLPSEAYMAEQLPQADPPRIHAVREALRLHLAQALYDHWQWAFESHQTPGAYQADAQSAGRRALAGLALAQLCLAAQAKGDPVWPGRAYQRVKDASNMSERYAALVALVTSGHELAQPALQHVYGRFKNEPLVLDKWFALQASAPQQQGDVLAQVRQLMQHPDFTLRNPNRARSLVASFCNRNPGAFHRADAAGYVFWAERVLEIDAFNPQLAARLARALDRWNQLAEPYRGAAREAIKRVAAKPELSADVREVVTCALASDASA